MEIIWFIIGVLTGGAIIWFVAKSKFSTGSPDTSSVEELKAARQIAEGRSQMLQDELESLRPNLEARQAQLNEMSAQLATSEAKRTNVEERLKEQKVELEKLNERFATEFKNLANEILEEKSKKFTDQNKSNLSELLNPLKEKIGEFQKKVEDTNKQGAERNASLIQQIKGLSELNKQMNEGAENLAKALKGDSKTQGNWGEVILERILEKSGLEKGREYETQVSAVDEEGRRYQPDVVVKLPDNKNIIIDSKVSLTSYERFVSSEDETEQAAALKAHITSIRIHIKGLSEKNYQDLYGIDGLDFVLLFVPIEPAFTLAVQHDNDLFNDAYSRNIVIVSPTTLIATLRTISSIWKQDNYNKNADEIARQSGALYDKFVSFTEDLKNIGKQLNSTQKTYQESMKKLYEGRGNLVRRVENIKKLGAKSNKSIDQQLLDRSEED